MKRVVTLGLSFIRELALVVMLAPLRFYKVVVSPFLPPTCRFHPSCSVYAMGALRVHGPFKGTWLTVRRLLRCHPFHRGGMDPVPPRDGVPAERVIGEEDPFVAKKLSEAPPPWIMTGSSASKGREV